jgi:hypothetical protein
MSTDSRPSSSVPCPLSPVPSLPLPPTARDFNIHRMSLVEHLSTRQIAEKYGISQTRVRQLISRVTHWLAAALPVKTEAEQEQEMRLAQHLAADQFQHQIEQLRIFWDGTSDPKYLRQQTRVIAALARLGIVPGTIDALAADVTDGPLDAQPSTFDARPSTAPAPVSQPWTLDLGPSTSEAPPLRACSPPDQPSANVQSPAAEATAATASEATTSDQQSDLTQTHLEGLKLMEERLLTLLENANPTDSDRRASLQQTLIRVRSQKAVLQLQVSPHLVGATVQSDLRSLATG